MYGMQSVTLPEVVEVSDVFGDRWDLQRGWRFREPDGDHEHGRLPWSRVDGRDGGWRSRRWRSVSARSWPSRPTRGLRSSPCRWRGRP